LASATGLITKTYQISDEGVAADEYGRKSVLAGAIYPANSAEAAGIIFDDVDVTAGPHEGSVIVAGRIFQDRLPEALSDEAAAALKASGIVFVNAAEEEEKTSE
jgi:hypothetical protein